jgi:hypothetical protein
VLAVMLGMMPAGLDMVVLGMAGVRVMRGLFVIAGFMMLGGFAVMPRCVFMVFGGLVMVLDACVVVHISLPVRQ